MLRLTAVEYSNVDDVYDWDEVQENDDFDRECLFPGVAIERESNSSIRARVRSVLEGTKPDIVSIPGWIDRPALEALAWCFKNGVPAIVMSETTPWDHHRVWWKEAIKQQIVQCFTSGFAGGTPHAEYLATLGLPKSRICLGYDVVDNDYFAREAAKWKLETGNLKPEGEGGEEKPETEKLKPEIGRSEEHSTESQDAAVETSGLKSQSSGFNPSSGLRSQSSGLLPSPFFLASARFIEKKNLFCLIEAFANYRRNGGVEDRAWDVDGSGPDSANSSKCGAGVPPAFPLQKGSRDGRPTSENRRTEDLNPPSGLKSQASGFNPPSGLRSQSSGFNPPSCPAGVPPAWDLVILGDGPLKARLIAHARSLGLNVVECAPWEGEEKPETGSLKPEGEGTEVEGSGPDSASGQCGAGVPPAFPLQKGSRDGRPTSENRVEVAPSSSGLKSQASGFNLPSTTHPIPPSTPGTPTLPQTKNEEQRTKNKTPCLFLPGFKQYHDLPEHYGRAGAFVHASTTEQWGLVVNEAMASGLPVIVSNRCGCAADLVQEGVNGFTFDPANSQQLADIMLKVSALHFPLSAFSAASRAIISNWGTDRFAQGLQQAAEAALAAGPVKPTLLQKIILKALLLR